MREFKRLLIAVLALTFLGGVGMGAWIGSLSAAPREAAEGADSRLKDWQAAFELTPSQVRQLRAVLYRYDTGVRRIKEQVSNEQYHRIQELQQSCREEIRENVLTDSQRTEYDKRRERG